VQYSTGKYPTILTEWRMKRRKDLYNGDDTHLRDWVSGAALAVRTAVFEEVGGFDERYFMYFEDVDLCARIRDAGHEIHYLPSTRVEHLGGGSQPGGLPPGIQKEYRRSQLLYYRAHASIVNNILLRAYLIARFVPRRFSPDREERSLASGVLSLVFTPRDEHRH
jgi:GT2 family glycosyltransferase